MPPPESGPDHDRSTCRSDVLSPARLRGGAGLGPVVAPCPAPGAPAWPCSPGRAAAPDDPAAAGDDPAAAAPAAAAAAASPAALSSVTADASSDGGPTRAPLTAFTLYVYLVSGSRPVCVYDLAALSVSAAAVSNRPESPALNSILYPVTDGPPPGLGLPHVRSIRSCDAASAATLPGLPGGLCATATAAVPPLPDSLVSVIFTGFDSDVSPTLSLALTANWCSRPVSRSLIVYDVSLPPALPCVSVTPLLKTFSTSYCVIEKPNVADGGSQSRRALVGDSGVMVTCVGWLVCSGFAEALAADAWPRPASLRAVTLYR